MLTTKNFNEICRTQYVIDIDSCINEMLNDEETITLYKRYWKTIDKINAFRDHLSYKMIENEWNLENLEADKDRAVRRLCGYIFRKNKEATCRFIGYVDDKEALVQEVCKLLVMYLQIQKSFREDNR